MRNDLPGMNSEFEAADSARTSSPPGRPGPPARMLAGFALRARRGGQVSLFLLSLALASVAHAQGVRYDNILLNTQGTPVSGASVAACTISADTGTKPCAPLAQIYSDRALTVPLANPFLTAMGNYGFYAAPGTYLVQIYGGSLTTHVYTVTLPCDPSASSGCGMANGPSATSAVSTGTFSVTGNISVTGTISSSAGTAPGVSGTPTTGSCVKWASGTSASDAGTTCGGAANPAIKPATTNLIQFVAGTGNDSNDGLSWGTAVADIYTAWRNLNAAANGGTFNFGGYTTGTIYVAATSTGVGPNCGGPNNQLLIIGNNSPDFASPPTGSLPDGAVSIIGVGLTSWVSASQTAQVSLNCGSSTVPALVLDDTNRPMKFENLAFNSGPVATEIGFLANGSRTGSGAASVYFKNVGFSPSSALTTDGPAVDVGAGVFEVYFEDCVFGTNTTAANGSDARQGMVINASTGQASGLISIQNSHVNGGAIKYYPVGASSLYVNGLVTEAQVDGHGAVWFTSTSSTLVGIVINVQVADATQSSPAVEVDGGGPASSIVGFGLFGNNINEQGPMTVLGGDYENSELQIGTSEPSLKGQVGFAWDRVWGQTDAARRLFPPAAIRFSNIAAENPSGWTITTYSGDSTSITTGVAGPDGTTYAATASDATSPGTAQNLFYGINAQNISYSAGDYVIFGGWIKTPSGQGPSGYPAGYLSMQVTSPCVGVAIGTTQAQGSTWSSFPLVAGDGEWKWFSGVVKFTTGGTCTTYFNSQFSHSNSITAFGPVFLHVATGTISDNEAADIATHLESQSGLAAPAESTLLGHPIAFGGSGDAFFATLDHTALTANRTYTLPNAAGTIALSGADGVSAGTVTLSGGSGSHTFGTAYNTAPTCTATDTTAANAVKATSSTTAVTLAGTTTDVIAWICAPAAN
jgi:hypothetical protein